MGKYRLDTVGEIKGHYDRPDNELAELRLARDAFHARTALDGSIFALFFGRDALRFPTPPPAPPTNWLNPY